MSGIRATFLGTGTSQGVPLIGCTCEVCQSADSRDQRLRSSLLLQADQTTVVIDSGPDFRQQLLRTGVQQLSGLVITHAHKDHIAGMDDIRAFNYLSGKPVDVYATLETQEVLRREFSYVFNQTDYPGIPQINLITINKDTPFQIGAIHFQPIEVMHYRLPVLGFRIADFTYITDANYISPAELEKVKGSKILVLNALRREKHISHFTLEQAIALSKQLNPDNTYFTHISHQLGRHAQVEAELPEHIHLAHDNMSIDFL